MAKISDSFRQAALRRGVLVTLDSSAPAEEAVVFAAMVEFANLGFVVDPQDLRGLSASFLKSTLAQARKVMGADRNMVPIYPGFPKQVEELSTLTLLVEQILHYWTQGAFLPNYPTVAREGLPLEDMLCNARLLKAAPASTAAELIAAELVANPVAISEDDRSILADAVALSYSPSELKAHPERSLRSIGDIAQSASNGENLQSFLGALVAHGGSFRDDRSTAFELTASKARSVDHLLRLILVAFTEPAGLEWCANYDLAVGTLADRHSRSVRYLPIPRSSRRLIVERLGELTSGFYADRLIGRLQLWRGVLRTIHSYELKLTPAARRAVDIVHGNIEHRTLNSLVEEALEKHETGIAAALLAEHQPGNLLRRIVAILRLTKTEKDAKELAAAVAKVGGSAALTTLISAYNGLLSANDSNSRVNRVAGLTNTMLDRGELKPIDPQYQAELLGAVEGAIVSAFRAKPAPSGPVGSESSTAVPLVRRDASTADRILDRGQEIGIAGSGDVLRIFGHWFNNQQESGYMDIGAVVLDENFESVAVTTWNSWDTARSWSTYSGDKLVTPGDSAPEFFDLKLAVLKAEYPEARWVAMTVQSWSGWPIADVDFIAGAMLRSKPQKGGVFDARSVATAFKPTTRSTQAVPFAVNLESGRLVWIDSSNGSTERGLSSTDDSSIGAIVYDEIARPRLTFGQLAELWAAAHGAEIVAEPVDRDQILGLL